MEVKGIVCGVCGDVVYSRARHDMRWCSCGNSAIDGGQEDYIKVTGCRASFITINVPNVTLKLLYNDWNTHKNKYGLIKAKPPKKEKTNGYVSKPITKRSISSPIPRPILKTALVLLIYSRKLTNNINDIVSSWVLRRLK